MPAANRCVTGATVGSVVVGLENKKEPAKNRLLPLDRLVPPGADATDSHPV